MMMSSIHMPWLSRNLTVVDSLDPTLVGLTGTVLEETRRTIRVPVSYTHLTLPTILLV